MAYIKLTTLFLLLSLAGYAQQATAIVNGKSVAASPADVATITSFWQTNDSIATANAGPDSLQLDLAQRPARLARAMLYLKKFILTGTLTSNQFNTFLNDARPQIQDYMNGSDNLITWFTTTYPNKSYYNALWQGDLINILK